MKIISISFLYPSTGISLARFTIQIGSSIIRDSTRSDTICYNLCILYFDEFLRVSKRKMNKTQCTSTTPVESYYLHLHHVYNTAKHYVTIHNIKNNNFHLTSIWRQNNLRPWRLNPANTAYWGDRAAERCCYDG